MSKKTDAFIGKTDEELVRMVEVGKFNQGGYENVALVEYPDGKIEVEIDLCHSIQDAAKNASTHYVMIGGICNTPEKILERIQDYRAGKI